MLQKVFHNLAILFFYAPPELLRFFKREVGEEYGVGWVEKIGFIVRAYRNSSRPDSLSSFLEHLLLIRGVLSVPKSAAGDVAEFGCFKGYSSSSLSLACRRTGRRLLVFDSFEGLPDPGAPLTHLHDGSVLAYEKGMATGALDEVKGNVARYGDISTCEFIKGFFNETLPSRPASELYCMIFEDADLVPSVKDVLENTWSRLQPGCTFYTHEARDLEVVKIFFDDKYWQEKFGIAAPGMTGSGLGMSYSLIGSCMGIVAKR
jgi:O-methyltransferase